MTANQGPSSESPHDITEPVDPAMRLMMDALFDIAAVREHQRKNSGSPRGGPDSISPDVQAVLATFNTTTGSEEVTTPQVDESGYGLTEVLPGMADMLPPASDPKADEISKRVIAARIRENALRKAALNPEPAVVTRQAEVAVHQGVANQAIANDSIEATGTKEPPSSGGNKKPRNKKLYKERSGIDESRDIANATAEEDAANAQPMTPEMRAARARLRFETDQERAGGDARAAIAYAATRDYRASK